MKDDFRVEVVFCGTLEEIEDMILYRAERIKENRANLADTKENVVRVKFKGRSAQ